MTLNYKNINSFGNVAKFDIAVHNEIGLIIDNKAVVLDREFDEIIIDGLPKKSLSLFFYKTDLYVSDSKLLLTKIFTKKFKESIALKFLMSIPTTIKERAIENYIFPVVYERGSKKRYNGKFDVLDYKLESKYELYIGINGIFQVLSDDLFLSKNNEKFGVFTFDNVCVWERKYQELYSDYGLTGGVDILTMANKLYVRLDKTYCVDIETGKTEQVYEYKFTNSENEFLYGLQFLSMTEFQLAILNTKTNTIKVIDVSNEFNKLNVYPDNRIVVNNGLVYFSQNMGTNVAKIGVLDPASEKILWKHDFEKKNGMIGTYKINGNRIYAHTQDRTLHIFEKEKNV